RVQLKGNQSQGLERWPLNDWHVIRGSDGWTRDIRAGAGANVGHSGGHSARDQLHHVSVIQRFQKSERVTTANENCFGVVHSFFWIRVGVNGIQIVSHLPE